MSSTDVQQPVSLESSALDGILRHHLTLEPPKPTQGDIKELASTQADLNESKSRVAMQVQPSTKISPTHKTSRQFSRPTVHQNTLESANKRRPIVLKRNSSRYRSPSPEPPDPNSEAKSVTIRRMQNNLVEWDKQLEDINSRKLKNEAFQQAELSKRDQEIKELTERLANETEARKTAEGQRDDLQKRLADTEEELDTTKDQCEQLHGDLMQYEAAYEEVSSQRQQLEDQLTSTTAMLQQSESMRRRLDDTVTELQGQLAIEQQGSKFCLIS